MALVSAWSICQSQRDGVGKQPCDHPLSEHILVLHHGFPVEKEFGEDLTGVDDFKCMDGQGVLGRDKLRMRRRVRRTRMPGRRGSRVRAAPPWPRSTGLQSASQWSRVR